MSWTDRKKAFYRELVLNGVSEFKQLQGMYPLGWAMPDETLRTLDKWFQGFHRVPRIQPIAPLPRLVNHFGVGADPEFIFTDEQGARTDAGALGLRAGLAFGADNNGRLCEIRPQHGRFQLEVLASILSTMRWLAIMHPQVRALHWKTGAYLLRDGLGGHVHLGRKQIHKRKQEVASLDRLAAELEKLDVFPAAELELRRRGDAHGQIYGRPGDVRDQAHGYEYRTFPSWLDSPWMAYFHLVLSKLAVFDPELMYAKELNAKHIHNLFRYFRGLDDDARIAYWAIERYGIPKHQGGDFRGRWGLLGYDNVVSDIEFLPQAITADPMAVEECWRHLAEGTPIASGVVPQITWSPTHVPKGFHWYLSNLDTRGQKGLGELLCDVVTLKDSKLRVWATRHHIAGLFLTIYDGALPYMAKDWQSKLPKHSWVIIPDNTVGLEVDTSNRKAKGFLLSGILPLWDISKVTDRTKDEWQKTPKYVQEKVVRKLVGKEIVL